MRSFLVVGFIALIVGSLVLFAQAPQRGAAGGDSKTPAFWSAKAMADLGAQASTRVSADTHMAGVQLVPSASMIYRNGDSGSEVHEKQADFIFVREGEGAIVVGGKLIGGKTARADEIRGDSIEGGTRYAVAAGDSIYIPANVPHQFFVENGKHFVINMVKITPQP